MSAFVMRQHASPLISVIIPSRDGQCGGNVERLLAALDRQRRAAEAEVILVVGESPNGHARNIGVDASRGRFLVFIDDDAGLLSEDVLERLLQPLEESTVAGGPIGMTGAATSLPADSSRFQRRLARELPRTVYAEVDRITDTDMAHHLCCALPRAVYEQVGRESDDLETGTDVDLRNRLRTAGLRIVVVPHLVATHPAPAGLLDLWRKHLWYGSGRVELDALHPPSQRNRIGPGSAGLFRYVGRALVTFPLRILRLERAASWGLRPLLATADLAEKLGHARATHRVRRGLPPRGPSLLSSAWLDERLGAAPPVPPPPAAAVRRLLLVATAGMGDALAMLPLAAALRENYPGARLIAWVSRRSAARVLTVAGVVDEAVCRDLSAPSLVRRLYKKLSTVLWLRRQRFDLAVVNFINSSAETGVLLRLGGARHRAGYVDDPSEPGSFNIRVPRPGVEAGHNALRRHLDLLPALGIEATPPAPPRFPVAAVARQDAAAVVAQRGAAGAGPVAALHPGCGADMEWKRWPVERFVDLGRRLTADGCRVWVLGGPDEAGLSRAVAAAIGPGATDMGSGLDLDVTAAVLEQAAVVVANDSGLYNLALALARPVVVIFGPSVHQISSPWESGAPAVPIIHSMPCHPCISYRQPPAVLACPIQRACLTEITVERVHQACHHLLEQPLAGRPAPPAGSLPQVQAGREVRR